MKERPPIEDAILRQIRYASERRRLVLFIGAGVTIASSGNHPSASWKGLLENGIEFAVSQLGKAATWAADLKTALKQTSVAALLHVAEEIHNAIALHPQEFQKWLERALGSIQVKDRSLVNALREIPAILFTTNYDNVLSNLLGLVPVTHADIPTLLSVLHAEQRSIVHLHGHFNSPDSVILGARAYDKIIANELLQSILRALFVLRTVVFVGFGDGIDDPHFRQLRAWMRQSLSGAPFQHYWLVRESDLNSAKKLVEGDGIVPVAFGQDHADLPRFLQLLQPLAVFPSAPTHVLIIPGILGPERRGEALRDMLQQSTANEGEVSAQIWDWTTIADEMNVHAQQRVRNREMIARAGRVLAQSIETWQKSDADTHLYVIACSGGARILSAACDVLSVSKKQYFRKAILLSPAIPRGQNMKPMNAVCADGVFSYYSPQDTVLGTFTEFTLRRRVAGRRGFNRTNAKLIKELCWQPWMFERYGCFGDHLGCLAIRFAAEFIRPLLNSQTRTWPTPNS